MGSISFEVNVTDWEQKLHKLSEKISKSYESIVYKSSYELFEKIKSYTPIGNPDLWHPPYWPKGYIPGTLKASWQMLIGIDGITIANNQPYAYRVEYGWSSQAPEGMMRRAILEYPIIVKRISSEIKL